MSGGVHNGGSWGGGEEGEMHTTQMRKTLFCLGQTAGLITFLLPHADAQPSSFSETYLREAAANPVLGKANEPSSQNRPVNPVVMRTSKPSFQKDRCREAGAVLMIRF